MRINPLVHQHRASAIQDIARKAGASRKIIFEELKRNEGAESALKDALAAVEACKADVKRQAQEDGDIDGAKDAMGCYDQAMAAVANLQNVAHINVMLLTGKLAQADEHINHCQALFEDEQRVLEAFAAAVNTNGPVPTEDYDSERDDVDGGVTPKAPPRPIGQVGPNNTNHDVPVGKPQAESDIVEPPLLRAIPEHPVGDFSRSSASGSSPSPSIDDDDVEAGISQIDNRFDDDGEDATDDDGRP